MGDARQAPPALEVRQLSKAFGNTPALSKVDLAMRPGEVHGLLGHNGSGKSTLIKILAGYQAADHGQVRFGGRDTTLPVPPSVLRDEGIRFVHQSLGLIDRLTVAENLWIDDIAQGSRRRVSFGALCRDAGRVLKTFGQHLDVRMPVAELTAVQKANLAIVRAMGGGESRVPSLLVLDEPTAFLPQEDKESLYELVARVSDRGAAVLFVSHFLDEVLQISDRVTVLRDGRVTVAGEQTGGLSRDTLVRAIIGGRLESTPPRPAAPGSTTQVRVEALCTRLVRKLSLDLKRGEIVGITGLIGSGCNEVLTAIFGATPGSSGTVTVGDARMELRRADAATGLAAGIGLVPADRNRLGVFGALSIIDNLAVTTLGDYRTVRGLNRRRMRRDAQEAATQYAVQPAEPARAVELLSGGNAQKVLMAKWLRSRPRLLLLEEPTQGVDVGARRQIEDIVLEAAAAGVSVVISSGDADQLAELCHRVLVLADGRVIRTLVGDEVTKRVIAEACLTMPADPNDLTTVEAS